MKERGKDEEKGLGGGDEAEAAASLLNQHLLCLKPHNHSKVAYHSHYLSNIKCACVNYVSY